jgi:uncharacterized protein
LQEHPDASAGQAGSADGSGAPPTPPVPPALTPDVPVAETPTPTAGRDREPVLDVCRGFALLGILLINIELMRGADLLREIAGAEPQPSGADGIVGFLTGWLAAGKFLSSFAIMFGLGAAMIAGKLWAAGRSPRGLLARRYAFLLLLGLLHMFLLFPGDILFVYGVAGMLLLAFVGVRARTALRWSAGILVVLLVLGLGLAAMMGLASEPPADDPTTVAMEEFFAERADAAVTAHQEGGYGDVVVANAWEALLVQGGTLIVLPWVLALFLFGFAVGRSGLVADLAAHRQRLRTAMLVALPVGLLLNVPTGFLGPMAMGAGFQPRAEFSWVVFLSTGAQIVGAPILAVGYLSAVALLSLRLGVWQPLAAVGRMALTAYLLQSVLALAVFWGLGLYDRFGTAQSMVVVAGIWAVLLVVCPLWMRAFRFGPVEWLWRLWTYGSRPPLRAGGPQAAGERQA